MDKDATLQEMNSMRLNHDFIEELSKASFHQTMDCVTDYINNLRHSNGRCVRLERRDSMIAVLTILYEYTNFDDSSERYGECSPSMRTIAKELQPLLELPLESDSFAEKRRKERILGPTLMIVQRSIRALCEFGIIKVHQYRAEKNRNDNPDEPNFKLPNFYYELVPVSHLSDLFAQIVREAIGKVKTVVTKKLRAIVDAVEESFIIVENFVKKVGLYAPDYWPPDSGITT
jgi:hypothetical protein